MNENPADNALRAALAGNDPAAVGLLWDRYAKDLLAFLQAILCSLHDAEDVLQIVFVRIVRKRHQLAKAHCLDAYIYRIARNEALRLIGHRKPDTAQRKLSRIRGSLSPKAAANRKISPKDCRRPWPVYHSRKEK